MTLDGWREIAEGWWRHRFRTAVTAGSVAWGVFLLVVLLASGTGLENNLRWEYRDDAINSIWVYAGQTTRPWKGHRTGRSIELENADVETLDALDFSDAVTGRYYPPADTPIRFDGRVGSFEIRATHPGHQDIEQSLVTSGRFLNDRDIDERRKVAVVGDRVVDFLFQDVEPIGQWLIIGDAAWRVVGVFTDVGGVRETQMVYIPVTTAQTIFGGDDTLRQVMFTVPEATNGEQAQAIEVRAKEALAVRHWVDPEDRGALRVRNNIERFADVQRIFTWLRGFIWLVGLGTVAAGVVGVSNIMLIGVQERTRELGLRKALGATPRQLIWMVVQEAIALTAISGYVGLLLGVGLVELIPENEYVRDPRVDLNAAVSATVLLILAGTLAGWFPAQRAARIPATEALRG